jgi:3-hydroxyisobutyrate dehydrogenase
MSSIMRTIIGSRLKICSGRPHPRSTSRLVRFFSSSDAATTASSFLSTPLSDANNNNKRKVAFLGLGNMGYPMALNLTQRLGSDSVIVYDLNDQTMDTARKAGMTVATSIESIMINHINEQQQQQPPPSTIITMLPGDVAVNGVMQVLFDLSNYMDLAQQTNQTSHKISTIIDCSTVSPTTSRYWYNAFQNNVNTHNTNDTKDSVLFVDAPVSGGVKGAQNASLTFMVGTSQDVLDDQQHDANLIHATLSMMGSRVIACGGPGCGSVVKLCNNLALAAQMVGICEAMNLGEGLGVNPQVLADVMNTSTAKSWSCSINNPHPNVVSDVPGGGGGGGGGSSSPASNDYKGGFGTKLMLKDLTLAVSAGNDVGVALPLGNLTKELYQLAHLRGLGDKDFSIMLQFLRGK